jgi:hypothetical protein
MTGATTISASAKSREFRLKLKVAIREESRFIQLRIGGPKNCPKEKLLLAAVFPQGTRRETFEGMLQ